MKEDFLHYVWENGFFEQDSLQTTNQESIKIVSRGFHNSNAGPDFLNARIMIGDILWAGNVEIHKKSSDWYAHNHEKDKAYGNVILHIVYEDNMPVYNSNNQQIATLVLSKYIYHNLVKNYSKLIKNKAIIRCQNELHLFDRFTIIHYKYKLFFERLQYKYHIVKSLLNRTDNNWDQVLYETLLKYFGGSVNKDAFDLLAQFIPYKVFSKYRNNITQLEALLFGVSGFLKEEKNDYYYQKLQREFQFLQQKHELEILPDRVIKFNRLRPLNFPTIRLAQFAQLYHKNDFLFDKLISVEKADDILQFLEITAGEYWDTHYNFDKVTKKRKKTFGSSFIDIILINVIVPIKFAYQKQFDIYDEDEIVALMESIKPEKNRIISTFQKINIIAKNALDSQAIIHLNDNYCTKKRCLDCDIAHFILKTKLDEHRTN
jgi:hypothetical protein